MYRPIQFVVMKQFIFFLRSPCVCIASFDTLSLVSGCETVKKLTKQDFEAFKQLLMVMLILKTLFLWVVLSPSHPTDFRMIMRIHKAGCFAKGHKVQALIANALTFHCPSLLIKVYNPLCDP